MKPQYTCIHHTTEKRYVMYWRNQEADTWVPYYKTAWTPDGIANAWVASYRTPPCIPGLWGELSFVDHEDALKALRILKGEQRA